MSDQTPTGRKPEPNPREISDAEIEAWGRNVVELEARGVAGLAEKIDAEFARVVRLLHDCPGRIVITGVGKSGIIGRKIAATLTSTGSPAAFLHPVEGLHGDIGMVRRSDVIIAISKSGNTEELEALLPILKSMKVPIVAVTSNRDSFLGSQADHVLDIGDTEEACKMDLVPTTSTTTTLALGDALAVALLSLRGFGPSDYRQLHPRGSIGRSLLTIADLMHTGEELPIVSHDATSDQVLLEMTSKRLGATCVVDEEGRLRGIITDGDLRRSLEKGFDLGAVIAADLMSENPKTIKSDALAASGVGLMEDHQITQLVITDADGLPTGIVHLHDLLRAKVV
jgi:arabinose-5-phosphate isomerase